MRAFFMKYGLLLVSTAIFSQTALNNNGAIQIHNGAEVGLHTSVINNGSFVSDNALVGFYSDNALAVSGSRKMLLHDVEVDVLDDLYLNQSLEIGGYLAFINGHINTDEFQKNVSLELIDFDVYSGEGDGQHVDGYVTSKNEGEFTFPIGDDDVYRPLTIDYQDGNSIFKAAYFNRMYSEVPAAFSNPFNLLTRTKQIYAVAANEFWDLDGPDEVSIDLTWNADTELETIAKSVQSIRVVGWHKERARWVDLGAENLKGTLMSGSISSIPFIPDEYEVITFGSDFRENDKERLSHNLIMTPNGDGINDVLIFEGIELRPKNHLTVLNRWGGVVYEKEGYANTWGGVSDHKNTIKKKAGLPKGSYFYILKFFDENKTYTGYIYLAF